MQAYLNRLSDKQAMEFINKFGDVFKTLPALPVGFIDFVVKIAPYLALLSAVLTVIGGPLIGLLGTFASLISLNPLFLIWTLLTVILMIVQAGLLFMAFTPLKERAMQGWILLFWSEVLGVAQLVLNVLNNQGGTVLLSFVFALFWFYVLFQMRPRYGKAAEIAEKLSE